VASLSCQGDQIAMDFNGYMAVGDFIHENKSTIYAPYV
jgi:hypothetical protein